MNEAIMEYREAIVLKPNDADSNRSLAIALKNIGQIDEATLIWKKAMALKERLP
jgi:Flp pilus assembly protein TadD